MSTAAVYNGFGKYESTPDGEKGITLLHGGVAFWFPFGKVTYLPDFTMREVDHRASSAEGEAESALVYQTFRLSGGRIAEELLETQIPVKNSLKGLILLSDNTIKKPTYVKVAAGCDEEGKRLFADVQEVEPSPYDVQEAERRALQFKQDTIKGYFQSKRERMSGGGGQLFPTGLIKIFMDELGVADLDDVFMAQQKKGASGMSGLEELVALLRQGAAPIVVPPVPPVPPPPPPGKPQANAAALV